ncbi:hypothetical protein [Sorangium sp. So ce131]|uniref:hypothetical protein n=1 Tax=Sorangium sp. So ce131 TaxID=3133282 RepID=UPI003F617C34
MLSSLHTDLDTFAELLARTEDVFADRAAVLTNANLNEKSYQKVCAHWAATFAKAPDGTAALAQRFGDAYARARQALRDARRNSSAQDAFPKEDLRVLSAEFQPQREEAAFASLLVPAAARTAAQLPSFLLPSASANSAHALACSTAASSVAPSPWIPASMRQCDDVHGTQITAYVPVSPALPFDPTAYSTLASQPAAPASPVVSAPKAMQQIQDVHGTQLATEAPTRAILPFEPRAISQEPNKPPAQAQPPNNPSVPSIALSSTELASWLPAGMRGFADGAGTMRLVGGGTQATTGTPTSAVLPFEPRATSQEPNKSLAQAQVPDEPPISSPALSSTELASWLPAGMRGFADVAGTQLLNERSMPSATEAPIGSTQPLKASEHRFEPISPSRAVERDCNQLRPSSHTRDEAGNRSLLSTERAPTSLSIEQYASLRVELDLNPIRCGEILVRYRITQDQWQHIHNHWTQRLAENSNVRAAWERAYSVYKAWILGVDNSGR